MTIKTTIGPVQGEVQTNNGSGLEVVRAAGNLGFSPFPAYDITTITSLTTMSLHQAGVVTVSGTNGIVAIQMPSASACPGSLWTFRNMSSDASYLSGSEYGVKTFCDTSTAGSRLQLPNVINQSVTLMSDGRNFQIIGACTASYTISGN